MTEQVVFIAVIGAGGVGQCFLRQLQAVAARRLRPKLALCYLSTSTKALYHDDYMAVPIATTLEQLTAVSGPARPPLSLSPPHLVDWLAAAPGPTVLVDNTSSEAVAGLYPLALRRGIHVITPNKKAFSGPLPLWREIAAAAAASGARVLHESSVGAGLPIISTLTDLVETGDEVVSIEGVFSGTLSFLFSSFAPAAATATSSGTWSDEVRRAKELGYTEPDPRDDLNGMDVARKLVILARLVGLPIESTASFDVQSLIPPELESCATADEFMRRLPEFDDRMARIRDEALRAGQVVRFVGRVDVAAGKLSVGIQPFPHESPLARLRGSDNLISFHTKRYGFNPLIVQGAGAGGEVTAMGVMSDLLKILRAQPGGLQPSS